MSRNRPITHPAPPVPERPKCPWCRRRLRPVYWDADAQGQTVMDTAKRGPPVARIWDGTYYGSGDFCSTTCCVSYANAEYRRNGTIYRPKKADA